MIRNTHPKLGATQMKNFFQKATNEDRITVRDNTIRKTMMLTDYIQKECGNFEGIIMSRKCAKMYTLGETINNNQNNKIHWREGNSNEVKGNVRPFSLKRNWQRLELPYGPFSLRF